MCLNELEIKKSRKIVKYEKIETVHFKKYLKKHSIAIDDLKNTADGLIFVYCLIKMSQIK